MKKILAIVLSCVLCFAFAACKDSPEATEDAAVSNNLPTAKFHDVEFQFPGEGFVESDSSDDSAIYTDGEQIISIAWIKDQTEKMEIDESNIMAKQVLENMGYQAVDTTEIKDQECTMGTKVDGDTMRYALIFLSDGRQYNLTYSTKDSDSGSQTAALIWQSLKW
ncbi:hypothetical protein NIA71_08345 [Ihubacter massiliensis]|uniref:hypothetical protein n=1 Tax=Ihubacter massiliensis TaxID=1852367 RepID=UPI00209776CE|nr:hypothetical protein [Ihubacter massiliensis]MCO7121959.1 hypothetical protein [Ihubacter massiliensis]